MKVFKGLLTTDHHCLNPRTPTRHILSNLDKFYYKDHNLAEIDFSVVVIFIVELIDAGRGIR